MGKKYKLTNDTIQHNGKILYRIEALRDFNNVEKGDKGGFVESDNNLSQEGGCWIYDNAKVFDEARVYNDARICDDAQVYEYAEVYGDASVFNDAKVCGNAKVYEKAVVSEKAYIDIKSRIYGSANVCDDSIVTGAAKIYGSALITENAHVNGDAMIYGSSHIGDIACVGDHAKVYGEALVLDNASILGNSDIHGYVVVRGSACIYNADILELDDYIVFKNWWSSGRYFTWTKSNNMWNVGCFYGTGEELIAKAYKDSELSGREYERIVRYVESINQPTKRLNRIQQIVCKLFKIK